MRMFTEVEEGPKGDDWHALVASKKTIDIWYEERIILYCYPECLLELPHSKIWQLESYHEEVQRKLMAAKQAAGIPIASDGNTLHINLCIGAE